MENQHIEEKSIVVQRRRVKMVKFFMSSEFASVMVALVIVILTAMQNPNFFTVNNLFIMLRNCSFIGILAIGQALIIMSGEMDLSVGSVSAFSVVVFGVLCIWNTYPIWVGILAAAGFAASIGFLNGFLMLKVGVMKWVATLATSNLCGSLAAYLTLGVPITPVPSGIKEFANITIGTFGSRSQGLSIIFFIFVGLVILAHIVIRYTKYGRMIQACGISSNAAYMAGVNVTRVKWLTLICVSLLAFVGGFLSSGLHGIINSGGLSGADFKTIAACYIGGIGFVGSTGSMIGLFLGVVLIQLIENSMSAIGWDPNVQICVVGALVMLVLTLDVFKRRYMASRIDLL